MEAGMCRNELKWTWLGLCFGFIAAGCAHTQAQTTTASTAVTPASPVKETPEPAKPSPLDEDLAALVQGSVIHFDFNGYHLSSDDQLRLQRLAEALKSHPKVDIRIDGNCDERGTVEYNLALGQERAQVAKKYLTDLGISSRRIETISYGEERPVDEGQTEEAWAANRRDGFMVARGQ
jgi:peptidoglycan-associated lipoprotein